MQNTVRIQLTGDSAPAMNAIGQHITRMLKGVGWSFKVRLPMVDQPPNTPQAYGTLAGINPEADCHVEVDCEITGAAPPTQAQVDNLRGMLEAAKRGLDAGSPPPIESKLEDAPKWEERRGARTDEELRADLAAKFPPPTARPRQRADHGGGMAGHDEDVDDDATSRERSAREASTGAEDGES
jgi:hypothetical protein